VTEGFEIPVILSYNKKEFVDKSPWVLFTKGSVSSKEDLAFDVPRLSLMDRGIVCAFPFVRGKDIAVSPRHSLLR